MAIIESLDERFCRYLLDMDATAVIGLATLMKVNLLDDDKEMREGALIINDLCDAFMGYNRARKKQCLKLMKKAKGKSCEISSAPEVENGSTTEDK